MSYVARSGLILGIAAILTGPAGAQQAKDIKTPKGKAAALVNLFSARPDCSIGTVSIPTLRDQPQHGTIQMTITVIDAAATATCPARKAPVITLIYVPQADFVGSDLVTVDIPDGNKTTSLSYRVVVGDSV